MLTLPRADGGAQQAAGNQVLEACVRRQLALGPLQACLISIATPHLERGLPAALLTLGLTSAAPHPDPCCPAGPSVPRDPGRRQHHRLARRWRLRDCACPAGGHHPGGAGCLLAGCACAAPAIELCTPGCGLWQSGGQAQLVTAGSRGHLCGPGPLPRPLHLSTPQLAQRPRIPAAPQVCHPSPPCLLPAAAQVVQDPSLWGGVQGLQDRGCPH